MVFPGSRKCFRNITTKKTKTVIKMNQLTQRYYWQQLLLSKRVRHSSFWIEYIGQHWRQESQSSGQATKTAILTDNSYLCQFTLCLKKSLIRFSSLQFSVAIRTWMDGFKRHRKHLTSRKKSALNFHITAGIGKGSREMSDQRTQPEINKITQVFPPQ